MMKLLIAEKYKVAQCFANVLNCNKKETNFDKGIYGYFYNNEWIVTWAAGHLIEMCYPDKYSSIYKNWSLSNLPLIPKEFKYDISKFGKKQFKVFEDILKHKNIKEIYHAADADREGELIVREILRELKIPKNIKTFRVWYTNTTNDALNKALKKAKPLKEYDNLYYAADCRQKIDWLVGINLSRAYTSKYHSTQNVGRVVSPTVNLIVERQKEIDNFIPEDYAVISVPIKKDDRKLTVEAKFTNVLKAEKLAKILKGKDAVIKNIESSEEKEFRKLFNTTQLQIEASKKFNYSPDTTMTLMQTLYEQGYITYPRTKSSTINPDQIKETELLLMPVYTKIFSKDKAIDTSKFDINRIVDKQNSNAEEASHTGLCPTIKGIEEYSKFKNDDKLNKIFLTITARLLCAVLPPRILDKTRIKVEIEKEIFQALGSVEKDPGFVAFEANARKLIEDNYKPRNSSTILPDVKVGEVFTCLTAKCTKKQTNPPEQYTIDQLLSAMENISRLVEDKKLKEAIKGSGLGTSSSRDGIIKTIQDSAFVELKQKKLYPTEKAKKLMSILPEDIKSPIMTAKMEVELDKIASGKRTEESFIKEIEKNLVKEIDYVKELPEVPDTERYANNKIFLKGACPKCGEDVVETDKAITCKHNCGFKIWKTMAKKKLTKEQLKTILTTGCSKDMVSGLKSKKGNDFSCWIYIAPNYETKFDFDKSGYEAKNNNIISLQNN